MKLRQIKQYVYSEPYYFVNDDNKYYYIRVNGDSIEYIECETLKVFKTKKIDKSIDLNEFLIKAFESVNHISETPVMFKEFTYEDGIKETVALFPSLCTGSFEYWTYRDCYALFGQHSSMNLSISNTKSTDEVTIKKLKNILESEPYNYKLKEVSRMPCNANKAIELSHKRTYAEDVI